jgi:hypothetical protein
MRSLNLPSSLQGCSSSCDGKRISRSTRRPPSRCARRLSHGRPPLPITEIGGGNARPLLVRLSMITSCWRWPPQPASSSRCCCLLDDGGAGRAQGPAAPATASSALWRWRGRRRRRSRAIRRGGRGAREWEGQGGGGEARRWISSGSGGAAGAPWGNGGRTDGRCARRVRGGCMRGCGAERPGFIPVTLRRGSGSEMLPCWRRGRRGSPPGCGAVI